jgi:hypothetical protein
MATYVRDITDRVSGGSARVLVDTDDVAHRARDRSYFNPSSLYDA